METADSLCDCRAGPTSSGPDPGTPHRRYKFAHRHTQGSLSLPRTKSRAPPFGSAEMGAAESVPETSVHEFTVKDSSGKEVSLEEYKGKVLLIVNVASKCGFTETNYTQLTELYQKYRDKDFEILAFPCNQFLRQEPGSDQQIKDFACTRFKAEYPVFQKVRVNGPDAAPLYKFLKASKPGLFGSRIKWNFTKFLVDKNGKVINRYSTATSPLAFEKDIQKALEEE